MNSWLNGFSISRSKSRIGGLFLAKHPTKCTILNPEHLFATSQKGSCAISARIYHAFLRCWKRTQWLQAPLWSGSATCFSLRLLAVVGHGECWRLSLSGLRTIQQCQLAAGHTRLERHDKKPESWGAPQVRDDFYRLFILKLWSQCPVFSFFVVCEQNGVVWSGWTRYRRVSERNLKRKPQMSADLRLSFGHRSRLTSFN